MKLIPIPKEKYYDYKLNAMFSCYKWDPQFYDSNTLAKYVLVLSKEEHKELKELTEKIDRETRNAEEFLNKNQKFAKKLALPKKISKEIENMSNYDARKHIRLMRYDFHQTIENKWMVSEVNSDTPGGFAEATLLPELARSVIERPDLNFINFGEILVKAISNKVKANGTIMLVHCTSFSDDRQVMQYLGDKLKTLGYKVIYGAADHLRFENKQAYSILDGNSEKVDGIFRFTPLEWLIEIKPKNWGGYFDTETPSCNHPISIFAQTKRFPLVWNLLEKNGIELSTWRKLLPETIEVCAAKNRDGFIYKPACGRVGEKISIQEACKGNEYKNILKDVKRHPKQYLAQKKFISNPICAENGEKFHVCLGSYTVEGKHAGYYARISDIPRIDSYAADIPVFIEEK